ncbi:MAG: ATP-binding protein [Bdellovibrionota bacterium]
MIYRLRNKVALLALTVLIIGSVGTFWVNISTYIDDKKNYVMSLSTMSAVNMANAMGSELRNINEKLIMIDAHLSHAKISQNSNDLFTNMVTRLTELTQLNIYSKEKMIHSFNLSSENKETSYSKKFIESSYAAGELKLLLHEGLLVIATVLNGRLYLGRIEKAFFQELLASNNFLKINIIIKGTESERLLPGDFKDVLSYNRNQTITAKETVNHNNERQLSVLAPIQNISGAYLLTQLSTTEAVEMAKIVAAKSLPVVVILVIVTMFLGILFSERLVRPIEKLIEATREISKGNWQTSLVSVAKDEIGNLVASFKDMGKELEKREQQLDKANRDLRNSERLAVLGKFSAGIAHEVKNPLNSVLGFAQLLDRKLSNPNVPAPVDEKKYISYILSETRRASRIISELLSFSRQEPPKLVPSTFAPIFMKVIDLLTPAMEKMAIELTLEKLDEQPQIELDTDQMYQVFSNLIINASHAFEVTEGKRQIKILQEVEGGCLKITVMDNGSGIAHEHIERIFEPFFTTKEVGKGTGLGLAVCFGIVSQHNGNIRVNSEKGKGSEFVITLPIIPSDKQKAS